MAQQSDNLRERLLAALPQPENLAVYREETTTLLVKHATALRWDKITSYTLVFLAVAVLLFSTYWHPGGSAVYRLQILSAILYFLGAIYWVRYEIYRNQVATLKEIKQTQLQILELQASLRKAP